MQFTLECNAELPPPPSVIPRSRSRRISGSARAVNMDTESRPGTWAISLRRRSRLRMACRHRMHEMSASQAFFVAIDGAWSTWVTPGAWRRNHSSNFRSLPLLGSLIFSVRPISDVYNNQHSFHLLRQFVEQTVETAVLLIAKIGR